MSVSFQVDLSEFNRAIIEHAKVDTKRSMAEIVNQNAYSVGLAASKMTFRADKEKIAADLGRKVTDISQNIRILKDGTVKAGRINKRNTYGKLAYAIVNARRKKNDEPALHGPEMAAAVNALYNRRVRAIGYLRFGWLASIAGIAWAIGKPIRLIDERRGRSIPARPSVSPWAELLNSSFSDNTSNPDAPRYAAEGLQAAIRQQIGRMRDWAAGHLQRQADKFSARMLR